MGKDAHTVSQTLVDYQRPSWYLLGCFSLKKKPEISITIFITFYNFIGVVFAIPGAHSRPLMYKGPPVSADTCSTLEI